MERLSRSHCFRDRSGISSFSMIVPPMASVSGCSVVTRLFTGPQDPLILAADDLRIRGGHDVIVGDAGDGTGRAEPDDFREHPVFRRGTETAGPSSRRREALIQDQPGDHRPPPVQLPPKVA